MSLLEVENLEVYYETEEGPAQAVDDVSFTLEEGENLGIVGESGCGKTTLAKAIIGILPDAGYVNNGTIRFKGDDMTEMTGEQRRRLKWEEISMIAQSAMNSLDPVYTIREQIVEAIETHMSWVFLTDAHAYKLKKPVRYPFLDFSTLEARRLDCLEEVRLNRRLADWVYLGVLPLTAERDGKLRLESTGGAGEPVDWLVHMRRLPGERMLDRAIDDGTVREPDVRRAAAVLARFYRDAEPVTLGPPGFRKRFEHDLEVNRRDTLDEAHGLPVTLIDRVHDGLAALLAADPAIFERRVDDGRVIEGHGDLRPDHICLIEQPVVIDCIEFNRHFRIVDAADELAFLGMECDRVDAPWIGRVFLEVYREITGDDPPHRLVCFHKANRAVLRAKISIWHLRDDDVANPQKWFDKAMSYLHLAERYLAEA